MLLLVSVTPSLLLPSHFPLGEWDGPAFVHPLTCGWTVGLFSTGDFEKQLWTLTYTSSLRHTLSSPLGTMAGSFRFREPITLLFQSGCTSLHSIRAQDTSRRPTSSPVLGGQPFSPERF